MSRPALKQLEHGRLFLFQEWPNRDVPQVAAGVYTVWRRTKLVYVGMAGRSLTSEQIEAHRAESARNKGLYSRLSSHASGRRSGDQFCVYVADRLVLPTLSPEQVAEIAAGRMSLDVLVRIFIHENLAYRFVEVSDAADLARRIEAEIRNGVLAAGAPLLNPSRPKKSRSARAGKS